MFEFAMMGMNTVSRVNSIFNQNILNAKNNQMMDLMSFGLSIAVYQDVCNFLRLDSEEQKF